MQIAALNYRVIMHLPCTIKKKKLANVVKGKHKQSWEVANKDVVITPQIIKDNVSQSIVDNCY